MKVLELFCGTKSFAKVCKNRGHETFTIDNNPDFNPDLCIDINKITLLDIPEDWRNPDIIWASVPCTTFSVSSIKHYWDKGKPKNDKAINGLMLVCKTIVLINSLNPKYYFIENPRGMLRKQFFMVSFKENLNTVSYCQYGDNRMKPTDIWTNCKNWQPKKMCKYGAKCHESSPRGSTGGTQGLKNNTLRSIVPEKLCIEIINACEQ